MAPVFTPFTEDHRLYLGCIQKYAEYLKKKNIQGILVNGTTGEGVSMTVSERKAVAEAWLKAKETTKQNVMVQISGCCLADAQNLAGHAEENGADAILCLPELFFRPRSIQDLVVYLRHISDAAPKTPLFYYHIPSFTDINFDMEKFMRSAFEWVKTFSGIKFTHTDLEMGARCVEFAKTVGLTVFLGADQILSGAVLLGFDSAIATTLNICPDISFEIYKHVKEGKSEDAYRKQNLLTGYIHSITKHGSWVSSMKAAMGVVTEFSMGPPRPPLLAVTEKQQVEMRESLKDLIRK